MTNSQRISVLVQYYLTEIIAPNEIEIGAEKQKVWLLAKNDNMLVLNDAVITTLVYT